MEIKAFKEHTEEGWVNWYRGINQDGDAFYMTKEQAQAAAGPCAIQVQQTRITWLPIETEEGEE